MNEPLVSDRVTDLESDLKTESRPDLTPRYRAVRDVFVHSLDNLQHRCRSKQTAVKEKR